jgi:adenylate cyclase
MNRDERKRLLRAVKRRHAWLGYFANVAGTAVVFISIGFLLAVFFDRTESNELGRENLPFVLLMVAVLGSLGTWTMRRQRRRALGWVAEDREPSEDEHRLTLGLPTFTALVTATGWALGGLASFALNLDHSLGAAAVIGAAVWMGGETTSALAYLMSERILRPVAALALAAHQPEGSVAPGVRERLLAAWSLGTAAPMMSVLVVGIVGITKSGVDTEAVAAACVYLGAVALAIGLLMTVITAKAIADPLNSVRAAVERVAAGDLEAKVEIDDASEVGLLQAGFNRMAEGLRERERIRDLFGRQVGEDVARAALRERPRLGGEEREIGAVFVDLVGSTSLALAMAPTEVVRLLNRFFRVVIEVVESEDGFVNKFEGDAALCVFGAPVSGQDPAGRALCAARRLAERLDREVPEVGYGIGVSAGKAVAGNVGSERRFEYTVIGDPVNEAARLSDIAKERDETVIASDAAIARAAKDEQELWKQGERTVLRGRLEATVLASPRA